MSKSSKERFEIELISRGYLQSKRILKEHQTNIRRVDPERYELCRTIVEHVENVTYSLEETERFIIEKEVLEGRRGKWYIGYLTRPSYYRYRKEAYRDFLNCL
ncbi:MAG: hypothetical protein IKI61_06805 [Erysipelotrichaceae bacterium]|jgi:hypothetical protein|nr:hypothetical protein [Erysipelotrichaceae bacterium]MCR5095733.1 hypothetical protein [Erysipelotrichaceae bacterium]